MSFIIAVLVALAIGIIIGWHLPEPSWAKKAESDAKEAVEGMLEKKKS